MSRWTPRKAGAGLGVGPMGRHTGWTDTEMLRALHMRDHEGLEAAQVAARLNRTRNSTIGMLYRVDKQTDAVDESPHLNGTMEPMWWKR